MSESDPLSDFRAEVRSWLSENFPPSLKNKGLGMEGDTEGLGADLDVWRERLAKKGWGAPTWPKEYGGAGLGSSRSARDRRGDGPRRRVQSDPAADRHGHHDGRADCARVRHRGQKRRHLPGIASGAVRWCLGLSEPNAGSDLASLTTKAEDKGDQFVVNGQKIWTSGADISQWCGALVRTDSEAQEARRHQFPVVADGSAGRAHAADQAHRRRVAVLRNVFRQCDGREKRSARQAERRLERGEAAAAARAAEPDRRARSRRRTSGEARRSCEAIRRHERRRHAGRRGSCARGSRAISWTRAHTT